MNIGKLSFDQIIKMSFDKAKIKFAFLGTLLAFLTSGVFTLAIKFLDPLMVDGRILAALDFIGSFAASLIILFMVLGLNLQIKAELGKAKKQPTLKDAFGFGWRAIGSILIFILLLIVFLAAIFVVSLLGKISFVGPYLMALLCLPMVIAGSFLVLLLAISGKLILPSIIENQKLNSWAIIKDVLDITKNSWKKIAFNFVLALLPLFTLLMALMIVIGGASIIYLASCWVLPGLAVLFKISMNMPTSLISIILSTSMLVIASFAMGLLIVMGTVLLYSIYLDAKK